MVQIVASRHILNMEFSEFNDICLELPGAYYDFPFDETTAAYRVAGKMFALTDVEEYPLSVNLKCQPEYVAELVEQYDFITPGYHMNKKHWITFNSEHSQYDNLLKELIVNSYNLVFSKLTRKQKEEVNCLST